MEMSKANRSVIWQGVLVFLFLTWGLPCPAQAAFINVPADHPTIQEAIDAAVAGDTVQVSPGTYVENIDFNGKAITVTSEQGPEVTIIDGNQNGSVVTFNSGEGLTSLLSGFTVQNGFEGITIVGSSPTITGNTITNNPSGGIGINSGSALIQGNLITGNILVGIGPSGAGIEIVGDGSVQILDNTISDNSAPTGDGGGIALNSAGTPTIRDNVIRGNTAGRDGGGISSVNFSNPLIVQNLIVDNIGGTGGGISWLVPSGQRGPLLVNNTIANNDSDQGSGIFADGFDVNTELIDNVVVAKAGQTAIFCGNLGDLNPPIFSFNNVFSPGGTAYGGICTDQTGKDDNISADPLFLDPSQVDYCLSGNSPSIDSGDNTASNLPALDIDGKDRIVDGDEDTIAVVDMGAFEFNINNPGILQFSVATYLAAETAGSVVITVTRKCSSSGQVMVDFTTSNGTASAGSDYIATSGTITFADGDMADKTFTIPLIDDDSGETDETVKLTLSNPTGNALLGSPNTAVLTITSDEVDLSITKTDSPDPVRVGDNLTYTLLVENILPSDGTGVTVTDTLPAGFTFVSATSTQGTCSQSAGTVTCSLGDLANGTSVTVTIIVTPTTAGTMTSNTASVVGNESDPDTSNNTDTVVTTVNPQQFTLTVTKSGAGDGIVTSTPSGITCGVDCSWAYDSGTSVTLTTNAAIGSNFSGWSGEGCSGTAGCTVTMNADKLVTATFSQAPFTFTDESLTPQVTPVKAVHITELRQAINILRSRNGLPDFVYTDSTLTARFTPIREIHITELRTAINGVFDAQSRTRPTFTDDPIVAGQTAVKKVHIEEIRSAVRTVEIPNVIGTFPGSGSQTQTGCQDPNFNGTFSFSSSVTLSSQTGSNFSGSATLTTSVSGVPVTVNISFSGTVTSTGALSGTFTFSLFVNGVFDSSGNGTFTGQLTGNNLTINFSGQDTVGDTCTFTGSLTGNR